MELVIPINNWEMVSQLGRCATVSCITKVYHHRHIVKSFVVLGFESLAKTSQSIVKVFVLHVAFLNIHSVVDGIGNASTIGIVVPHGFDDLVAWHSTASWFG
jgi:hypothetical protein